MKTTTTIMTTMTTETKARAHEDVGVDGGLRPVERLEGVHEARGRDTTLVALSQEIKARGTLGSDAKLVSQRCRLGHRELKKERREVPREERALMMMSAEWECGGGRRGHDGGMGLLCGQRGLSTHAEQLRLYATDTEHHINVAWEEDTTRCLGSTCGAVGVVRCGDTRVRGHDTPDVREDDRETPPREKQRKRELDEEVKIC